MDTHNSLWSGSNGVNWCKLKQPQTEHVNKALLCDSAPLPQSHPQLLAYFRCVLFSANEGSHYQIGHVRSDKNKARLKLPAFPRNPKLVHFKDSEFLDGCWDFATDTTITCGRLRTQTCRPIRLSTRSLTQACRLSRLVTLRQSWGAPHGFLPSRRPFPLLTLRGGCLVCGRKGLGRRISQKKHIDADAGPRWQL